MPHITQSELTAYLVENQARFYRLAYSYLHDREEALDAVQTAVCKALEKQDGLKNADAMRIWFYRILVNVCTDQLRRRKRVVLVPQEALDAGSYEDPLPADRHACPAGGGAAAGGGHHRQAAVLRGAVSQGDQRRGGLPAEHGEDPFVHWPEKTSC